MCISKFKKGDLIIATSPTKSGDRSHMSEHIKFISVCECGYSITYEWTCGGIEGKRSTMSKRDFEEHKFVVCKPCSAFKRACEYFCCCCHK